MNGAVCICPTGDLGEGVAVVRVSDHESLRVLAFFCEHTRTAYFVTDLDTGDLVLPEEACFSPEMKWWQRTEPAAGDKTYRMAWLARAGLKMETIHREEDMSESIQTCPPTRPGNHIGETCWTGSVAGARTSWMWTGERWEPYASGVGTLNPFRVYYDANGKPVVTDHELDDGYPVSCAGHFYDGIPYSPQNCWQDKPDSDGLWWVVDCGQVEIVHVRLPGPTRTDRSTGAVVCCPLRFIGLGRFFAIDRLDGPWLKAVVPEMPEKEPK